MNNREVAHLWNAQSRQKASGSHFYFEGPTIYSYGPHFPIARIHARGVESLVLFTSHDYSMTTAKHKSYTLGACSNRPVIVVPHIEPRCHADHAANLKTLADRQAEALASAKRRMRADAVGYDLGAATCARDDYSRYCAFFGIKRKPLDTLESEFNAAVARAQRIENPDPKSADKRERARAQRLARKVEKEKRQAALRAVAEACARSNWRLGRPWDIPDYTVAGFGQPVMLRVDGDQIITSQGARVPLAAAPMVWRLVQHVRAGNAEADFPRRQRMRIGDYPLDAVSADGTLHAGCHVIPYSELSAMARRLGLS